MSIWILYTYMQCIYMFAETVILLEVHTQRQSMQIHALMEQKETLEGENNKRNKGHQTKEIGGVNQGGEEVDAKAFHARQKHSCSTGIGVRSVSSRL